MIQGDSTEYEILEEACKTLDSDNLFTAEIGVRQGQGSKIILEIIVNNFGFMLLKQGKNKIALKRN